MQKVSLTALVRHHLETASTASSGRSAHTIYGGHEHVLRQTSSPYVRAATWTSMRTPAKPPSRSYKAASPSWPERTDGAVHPVTSCSSPTPAMPSRQSRTRWSC